MAAHGQTGREMVDPAGSDIRAAVALAQREVLRFLRQPTRLVGAVAQPVIFWVLFGAGLGASFAAPAWAAELDGQLSYQEYFFPGIAVLIVLFTAIFSTISIIEDRREGFLQGVLVAPVNRTVIVLGKVAGGTALAMIQAALFMIIGPVLSYIGLAPEMQISVGPLQLIAAAGFLLLIAVELTALGFLLAWPMSSTQGFHAVMSVFLMPMWLLSGAFFPGGDSGWLSWVIRLNPLTYGVAGLRRVLYAGGLPASPALPSMTWCFGVTLGFCVVCVALGTLLVSRPTRHNVV